MVASAVPAVVVTVIKAIALAIPVIAVLPKTINGYGVLFSRVKKICSRKVTMVIDEFDGQKKNKIYEAAVIYLSSKFMLEHNEKMKDDYDGHKFKWVWLKFKCFDHPEQLNSIQISEAKSFKLTFRKKDKEFVLKSYLPFVKKEANI